MLELAGVATTKRAGELSHFLGEPSEGGVGTTTAIAFEVEPAHLFLELGEFHRQRSLRLVNHALVNTSTSPPSWRSCTDSSRTITPRSVATTGMK